MLYFPYQLLLCLAPYWNLLKEENKNYHYFCWHPLVNFVRLCNLKLLLCKALKDCYFLCFRWLFFSLLLMRQTIKQKQVRNSVLILNYIWIWSVCVITLPFYCYYILFPSSFCLLKIIEIIFEENRNFLEN